MADFVGGPDVKMDGVVFSKEEEDCQSVSPRSPLCASQELARGRRQPFLPFLDSDDSEDSDQVQSRGRELQKLKARLSKLNVGNAQDQVRPNSAIFHFQTHGLGGWLKELMAS